MSNLPTDQSNRIAQLTPATVALARTVDGTISTSTEITFAPKTRIIRVYAIAQDVYLKWGSTAVSASNFDEVIPANQVMDFFVPQTGLEAAPYYPSCTLIERAASATVIVIEK